MRHLIVRIGGLGLSALVILLAFQNCSEKELTSEGEGGFLTGSLIDFTGTACEKLALGNEEVASNEYLIDLDQGGPLPETRVRCLDFSGGQGVELTLLQKASNVDLSLMLKQPIDRLDVTVVIPNGVTIGSETAFLPALKTGVFAEGSTLKLINNGIIQGAGGKGGHGGACGAPSLPGEKGGIALEIFVTAQIENANGEILGGGGGGGGGGDACQIIAGQLACGGGGGGGGGAGSIVGAGGTFTQPQGACNQFQGNFPGENGASGAGGRSLGTFGGVGGGPGEPGTAGQSFEGTSTAFGQPGGPAGEAIVKNGNPVEILSGAETVKGPVLEGLAPVREPLPL